MPAKPQYDDLQHLISRLSELRETDHFSPHVTLLGQLSQEVDWIEERFTGFFPTIEPFKIILDQIGMFDQYYRSIIMHAEPSSILEQLYSKALQTFQVEPDGPFVPHLSLLYSDYES